MKKPSTSNIVWMNAGAGDDGEPAAASGAFASLATKPVEEMPSATPEIKPEPTRKEEPEEAQPILTAAKSDIQLPTATPKPTPSATPTPRPTPKPTATRAPKPTPTAKPTPKSTPKPKPKSSPKKLLAKASPKASATRKEKENEENDETAKKKEIAKTALAKKEAAKSNADESGESSEKSAKKAVAAHTGKKPGSGAGGEGTGAGGSSEFGWYGNMLHDRFYSEWMQPTTNIPSGAKISALVKIRIEKDGTVSDFKIVKPSGNVVIDESVEAVAKRVTQVDPLPAGLGDGGHYDVNINFEVNPNE